MYKKLKILLPVTALILVVLVVLKITGVKLQITTGLSSDSLFKVEGQVCKLSEGKVYLANVLETYKATYGEELLSQDFNGITSEEFLKENVVSKLSKVKVLNKMAEKREISLNDEEKKLAKEAANAYWKELGEKNAEKLDVTKKQLETMYQEYILAEKTFEFLTEGEEVEISEDEARIIVVWHIYFKTYEKNEAGEIESYSAEEKKQVLAEANRALQELEAGADFADIAKNYSDDTSYEYEIGRGEMPSEFDEVAFNLEAGEVSQIVETPYGYHIIKCISDFEEGKTKLNKERLLKERRYQNYEQIYGAYIQKATSIFNEKAWKKVTLENVDFGTGNFFSILEELKKTDTSQE